MASKLDYLKKYMSKSEARQLHSQMEKGEQIKIRNSSRVKRRKKQGNRTGFVVCNPERDPARIRDSQSASSDGSEEEGPVVVSYRDDSRDTRDGLWNPISQSGPAASEREGRHDSDTELSRRRHDSDSEVEVDKSETRDAPQKSGSDSDFEVKRKSPGPGREGRGSRWSRDEGVKSGELSCTVLLRGDESSELRIPGACVVL